MNEAVDYTALSWVRQELNEKLIQARRCLEEFAESAGRAQTLESCISSLHEARGALRMLDLQGAERLASEMEAAVSALSTGHLAPSPESLEVLMQAFIQLPDYLSRLHGSRRDAPVALLPHINRLRALCGEEPLPEDVMFNPDLTIPVPVECYNSREATDLPEVQALASTYRQRFQAGLVEWYRTGRNGAGLQKLHEVLTNLQQASRNEAAARLWWFSAALAEALARSDLTASTEIKQLFGRIDRELKRLVAVGESAFSPDVPPDLLRQLLFHILQSDSSAGRVGDIREIYAPKESDRRAASESLSGCSETLYSNVAAGACERIEQLKTRLDALLRAGTGDPSELAAIAGDMHALGNTMGMIGLEEAGRGLTEQARQLQTQGGNGEILRECGLTPAANTLLAVDAMLREFATSSADQAELRNTSDHIYRESVGNVIREVIADMIAARERIDSYLRMPAARDLLSDVPLLLNRVRGGLLMAGEERAAALVAQVGAFVSRELIGKARIPGEPQLDAFADAVCSIEYYVEELRDGAVYGGMVLDVAQQGLDTLGLSSVTAVPTPCAEEAAVTVSSSAVTAALQEAPVISALQVIAADIDREILDIFVEEASGEVRLLDELIPGVIAGEADGETLETMRRALHTLKGSGRMVGAMALGEFAYVFERLLKQLIDGTAGSGEAHHELLSEFTAPLAELLEQVKGGPAPRADVDALVRRAVGLMVSATGGGVRPAAARADAISTVDDAPAGDDSPAPATEPAEVSATGEPASGAPGSALPALSADADPEIVELFLEEATEQLAVISENLPLWLADHGNQEAMVTACRAFHTLKGSGRVAGALLVGEFAWAIEALLHRLIDGTVAVDAEIESLLGQLATPVSELLAQVGGGPAPVSDIQALTDCAQRLARGEFSSTPISATAEGAVEVAISPVDDAAEGERELIEIFVRECRDHLQSIQDFIAERERGERDHRVTEPLYRALHTLAGIAESAHITFISELAAELYRYFGALAEAGLPAGREAVDALGASVAVIAELADRLPDRTYDPALLESLRNRIRALPQVELAEENDVAGASCETPASAPSEAVSESRGDPPGAVSEAGPEGVVEAMSNPASAPIPAPGADHYADIDPELFEVFLEEAREIVESSEATLHSWIEEPGRSELMNEFQRQLHTLKGGARMINIAPVGDLSHNLETLLNRVVEGQVAISDELFALLRQAHDRLANMLEKVRSREMPDKAETLMEALNRLGSGDDRGDDAASDHERGETAAQALDPDLPDAAAATEAGSPEAGVCTAEPKPAASSDVFEAVVAADAPCTDESADDVITPPPERRKATRVRGDQVRVQAELLDNLVNYSGEMSIYRSRLEQQIGIYRFNLAELHQTINRVRDQLRQFEIETETQILHRFERESEDRNLDFDPLEMDRYSNLQQLSRSLVETISDLHSIQELLDNTTRETEALLLQQSRVSTDLQEGLMRARMIPFAGLAPRLRRIVRQAAGELGKQAELTLDGAEGELDRNVIERIVAPLEHMLRNAVDHGIERPEERRDAGKPETGTVRISFRREGPEIVLEVADDGRGLNQEAIRERAVERGLLAAGAQLTESEIMQFVLQTGFSTADKVTQISGRGVGMDVVNSEVKQLGGSLLIDSSPGKGSTFTIRLPYTLASNQALLVRAGEDTFCIPLGSIDGVVRVDAAYLAECYRSPEAGYRYAGNLYQLHHLGTLLKRGSVDLDAAQGRIPVLLVRVGDKRLALQVEALIGNREIVIKPLGPQLSSVHGVSGATILGDGRVILILDMAAVARLAVRPQLPSATAGPDAKQRLLVMVVDDSITVRKVTTRLLERYGFEVMSAKDGVDAMSQLQERAPDIMLLDIEMPRMDGFELARHVRSDERLRHIPITMITSRTGDKHRERAAQVGVNHYLGKPFQEHELLKTIHQLIGLPMDDEAAGATA